MARKQLYFHHIPKTGGTTLTSLLEMHVPRELICPANSIDELRAYRPSDLQEFVLFRGTFANELVPLLHEAPVCITLIRNPIERAISHYMMNRRLAAEGAVPSLPEAIDHPAFEPIFNNYMARYLTFEFTDEVRSWAPPFDPPNNHIEQARVDYYPLDTASLRQRSSEALLSFDIVGTTSQVYQCYKDTCAFMDWEGRLPERFRNTGDATLALQHLLQLSEQQFQSLLNRNAIDCFLFEVAKQIVRTRRIPVTVP